MCAQRSGLGLWYFQYKTCNTSYENTISWLICTSKHKQSRHICEILTDPGIRLQEGHLEFFQEYILQNHSSMYQDKMGTSTKFICNLTA